jgi:hypothetical protein
MALRSRRSSLTRLRRFSIARGEKNERSGLASLESALARFQFRPRSQFSVFAATSQHQHKANNGFDRQRFAIERIVRRITREKKHFSSRAARTPRLYAEWEHTYRRTPRQHNKRRTQEQTRMQQTSTSTPGRKELTCTSKHKDIRQHHQQKQTNTKAQTNLHHHSGRSAFARFSFLKLQHRHQNRIIRRSKIESLIFFLFGFLD